MRDGVHAAEAFLKGRGSHQCGRHHLGTRFDVLAIFAGPRQETMNEAHALERKSVGERMESGSAKRFEAMDQRIDTSRCRYRTWQPDRQLRIADHDARHHLGVEDYLLLMCLLIEDDARPPYFRAGAGGRRHGHDRRNAERIRPAPPVTDVLEVP